jgi:hypothetical protein
MFLMNKKFVEKIDKHRRSLFWVGKKKKKNTIWLNGREFAARKRKGVWVSRSLGSKPSISYASGGGN